MKKIFFFIFFLLVLLVLIELKLNFLPSVETGGIFLLMFLVSVLGSYFAGVLVGFTLLISTLVFIAFIFLSPTDGFLQFSNADIVNALLFFIEGTIILLVLHLLREEREGEREMREKFQGILSSIGDAVIATDKKGRITFMNAGAQKMTGWKIANARDKHITEVITFRDPKLQKSLEENVGNVLQKGIIASLTKPGTLHRVRQDAIVVRDTLAPLKSTRGTITGMVIIMSDVTKQQEFEKQREVLYGSVSHELKNHIAGIQGYAQLLQKKLPKKDTEQAIGLIDKLLRKVETTTDIITSMLDLSKIKLGKLDMKVEEFDMEELASTVIGDMGINTDHTVRMQGYIDKLVKGDKIKISQVLTNLLSNAIKYSPPEEPIIVQMESRDNHAIVSVIDKGKGIPKEKMDKLFNPFYRAANENDKAVISGTGLGLYISKEILRSHEGDIWVKSTEGEGSTFSFSLPLSDKFFVEEEEEPEKSRWEQIKNWFFTK